MAKYQRPNTTNSFLQASGDCIGTGIYGNGLVFDNQRYPFQVDGMPMQPPAANNSQYKPQPGLPRHTISRAAIRRERRIQHQQQQQQQHQQQQQPPTPRTPQAMSRFPSQSQSPFVSQQLKRQQQQQTPIRQERVQQQQGEQQEQQEEQQQHQQQQQQQQQQLPTLQQQQLQLQQQLLQFQQQQLQRQQELQRQQQQQMYGSWPFGRNPMCSNTQAFPNNPLSQVYNYGANPLSSSFWPGYTMITSPDASIPFAFGLGPTDVNEITNTIL